MSSSPGNVYVERMPETMKAFITSMLTIALLCTAVPCSAVDFEAQTGFRFRSWSSDADEDGYQVYLPVYLRGALDRFSWGIVAGYAYTSGDFTWQEESSIGGILDTQLNLEYSLPQLAGIDWLVGMDVNVPTGRTGQDPRDVNIMLDSDLVWIVSPGQGLNFNPFINAARQWNAWTFGLGIGYAFQGEYDYSSEHPDYDPGDILNLAAEVRHDWTGGWQARIFGQYATFGTDELGGEDVLERGDIMIVGAGLRYRQERYALYLTVQSIFREKNKYLQLTGIGTEPHNSNGDEWQADLGGQYKIGDATTALAALSFLYIDANDYERDSYLRVGRRTKGSLALSLRHALNESLDLQGGIEGFLMEDDPNWRHPDEDRSYRGWSVSLSATTRF
jgi:hypothetical protein